MLGAAVLAACTLAAAQTNVYRWVDKDGKVHFSDSPPPKDAKEASQKRMGGGAVEDSQLPYATQVAMKRNPVTLYFGDDCGPPCNLARDLLTRRGIPYTPRNAQTNAADHEALKKLAGAAEVPLLLVGNQQVKGFNEELWHQALDTAGYPRTRLPGQLPAPAAAAAASPAAPPAASAPSAATAPTPPAGSAPPKY